MAADADAVACKHFGVVEPLDAFRNGMIDVAGDDNAEIALVDLFFDLVAVVAGDAVGWNVDAAFEAMVSF